MKAESDRNQYSKETLNFETFGTLTSYSCESLRLSLALRSSVCSASSEIGMGGWFIMPARQKRERKIPHRERKERRCISPVRITCLCNSGRWVLVVRKRVQNIVTQTQYKFIEWWCCRNLIWPGQSSKVATTVNWDWFFTKKASCEHPQTK